MCELITHRLFLTSIEHFFCWTRHPSNASEFDQFHSKDVMHHSCTTRHEPLGIAALFSFAGAVPDEIYLLRRAREASAQMCGAA
jgi:hypothetical protein